MRRKYSLQDASWLHPTSQGMPQRDGWFNNISAFRHETQSYKYLCWASGLASECLQNRIEKYYNTHPLGANISLLEYKAAATVHRYRRWEESIIYKTHRGCIQQVKACPNELCDLIIISLLPVTSTQSHAVQTRDSIPKLACWASGPASECLYNQKEREY